MVMVQCEVVVCELLLDETPVLEKSTHCLLLWHETKREQSNQVLKINNDNLYSWAWIKQFTADQVLLKIVISGQVFELPLHFPL